MTKPRPKTIARILESVGCLRYTRPGGHYGRGRIIGKVLTITEIAEETGINQSRLKPIIKDLRDSQLLDIELQQTTFRRPLDSYEDSPPPFSALRTEVKRPKPKIPRGLTPAEKFEYQIEHAFHTIPIPQHDFYFKLYRTELGQEWLRHYKKHPKSTKKLREIQERHRLSRLLSVRNELEPLSPNDLFEAEIRKKFMSD